MIRIIINFHDIRHIFCINKYNRTKNWRLWGTIQILPFHSLGNHQKTLYFEQTNKMTMIMTMTMTSISSAAKTRGFFWVSERPQGTNCVAFRDGRRPSISHLSSIWSEINWTFIRLIWLDWLKLIELDLLNEYVASCLFFKHGFIEQSK